MASTTQTQTNTQNYWVPLVKTYTGTPDQPDVVSIFLKSGEKNSTVKIADEQIVNEMSHSPLNLITAFPRIEKAAKIMFKEIKKGTCFNPESEFWNAFKNGVRGIVQLVPLLGNAILWAYDGLRTTCSIHPKIKTAIAEQQNVIGVAFDGKPVMTMPLNQVSSKYEDPFSVANYCWASLLQRRVEEGSQLTRRELLADFKKALTRETSEPYGSKPYPLENG